MIAVLLPELVERHWLHYFLHKQRPEMIALQLMRQGKQRIMIVNVPWHMPDCHHLGDKPRAYTYYTDFSGVTHPTL